MVLLFAEAHGRQEVVEHFRDLYRCINNAILLRHAVDETVERAFQVILQGRPRCVLPAI